MIDVAVGTLVVAAVLVLSGRLTGLVAENLGQEPA
jgi:hypothetical protein